MIDSTTLTLRLSGDLKARLDRVAVSTKRSKSWLAGEAIEAYVARELAIIEGIERGIEDMKAGRGVPHEQAMARIRATIAAARPAKTA